MTRVCHMGLRLYRGMVKLSTPSPPTGEQPAMTIDLWSNLRYNHPETDRREHRGKRQQLRWYGRRDASSP